MCTHEAIVKWVKFSTEVTINEISGNKNVCIYLIFALFILRIRTFLKMLIMTK